MIAGAEAELGKRVTELLTRERLVDEGAAVKTFSTPRRLAVLAQVCGRRRRISKSS